MARGSSFIDIIVNADTRGAQNGIRAIGIDLADAAKGWAAFEGVNFLKGATEGAAALAEAQSTVDVVFGQSADTIRSFGEGAADSIGLGERAALAAAGNFGTLFAGMEVGQEQAAQMSERMLQLAADMSAARNVPLDEAITAIFSGLSGEQEPLKRFGVLLNEATVKEKALEMGLYSGVGALDASSRAQATYALILDKTTTMHGAAAREMNGLLGEQKRASAEWENTKDQLGQQLIPVMTAATSAIGGLGGAFGDLPSTVQMSTLALGGWALVGPTVVSTAISLTTSFRGLGSTAAVLNRLNSTLNNSVARLDASTTAFAAAGAGVAAFTATSAGLQAWSDAKQISVDVEDLAVSFEHLARTQEVRGELAAYGEDLDKLADAFRNVNEGRGDLAKDMAKGLVPVVGPLWAADDLTDADAAAETIDKLDDALAGLVASAGPEVALQVFNEISEMLQAQGISLDDIYAGFNDYGDALATAGVAAGNAAAATDEDTAARERNVVWLHKQETVIDNLNAAMERRLSKMEGEISAQEALTGAQVDLWNSTAELAAAQDAAAGNSEEMRQAREQEADAARSLADAQEAVADAEKGVADAQEEVRDRREALNEAWAEATQRIDETARAARQAALDESQAVLDVRAAEIELQRILSDSGSTKLEKDQARQDLAEAIAARDQAAADAAQARLDALNAQNPNNDDQVIAAREALADAEDGVTEAKERVADATDQVAEAHRRVDDAARNTVKVEEDAARRLVDAQAAHEEATLRVAKAQGDVAAAAGTAEDGIRAWQRALADISADLDPNSPLRTRIRALIEDLGRVLSGGLGPDGLYGSPDAADRGTPIRPSQPGDYGSPDAGDRGRRRAVYSPTIHVYGSSLEERRLLEQHQDRQARKFARDMTGG